MLPWRGHVWIMLPDFDGLRRPSSAIADCFSSKSTPCEASQPIKNFFLQYFSEKVLLSSNKSSPFCAKSRPSAAKTPPSLSTSLQNAALRTAANPTPTPALIPEPDGIARFFDLWLAQPSWSPIILTQRGWQTVLNDSGKKVPLNLGMIESHYRRAVAILGKRFGRLTNYLMIDVDTNSPFHPRNLGLKPILDAMDAIGLCRYLLVRSSSSGGLHIYFPLAEPVSSLGLAHVAHAALTAHGVNVVGGQCELFPNKRSFNAEHNGHRLPLQDGSFLLDDDFSCVSNEKAYFVHRWQTAATHQDETQLQQSLAGHAVLTPVLVPVTTPHALPPIAWTQYGKSNDTMRELVNYGDRYVGHKTIDDLAAWVKAVAPLLPGYQQFASPKSKQDIEQGTWPRRWAKSHFKKAWMYKTGGSNHNAEIAADAKRRLFKTLKLVCVDVNIAATTLFQIISKLSKVWHGVGFGPATFKKHEAEIMAYVKQTGVVGLSRGQSEDVNSLPSESAALESAEPEIRTKKSPPKLSTLRCVLSAYSNAFDDIHTPKNEVRKGKGEIAKLTAKVTDESAIAQTTSTETPDDPIKATQASEKQDRKPSAEQKGLTVGQQVRIAMPGGSLDGIETRVLAQALNILGQPVYQLEHQREGQVISLPAECLQVVEAGEPEPPPPRESVIRATAAQLLQVLGEACPFVGPGRWDVKRDDVPVKAWGQLLRLVGEEELRNDSG